MSIHPGINMEFVRHDDKSFAAGLELARQIGYEHCEPMVHNGRELLSEAGYFHSVSLDEDPLEIKDVLAHYGMKPSGLSSHTPLMRPEISVPYLEKAIRFAAAIGAPVVNTDEGIRPSWLPLDEAWHVMQYTLTKVLQVAERHGVYIGIEPHQSISRTTAGLLRIATLVDSPWLSVNYDTGNVWHYAGVRAEDDLPLIAPHLAHIHLKDVRGAAGEWDFPALGEGTVDFARILAILRDAQYGGPLSVEIEFQGEPWLPLAEVTDALRRSREHLLALGA